MLDTSTTTVNIEQSIAPIDPLSSTTRQTPICARTAFPMAQWASRSFARRRRALYHPHRVRVNCKNRCIPPWLAQVRSWTAMLEGGASRERCAIRSPPRRRSSADALLAGATETAWLGAAISTLTDTEPFPHQSLECSRCVRLLYQTHSSFHFPWLTHPDTESAASGVDP